MVVSVAPLAQHPVRRTTERQRGPWNTSARRPPRPLVPSPRTGPLDGRTPMRRTLIATLTAAGCLAAAHAAVASTLAVQGGTTLQFTAGAGETNDVTVSRSATLYTVTDPGSTIA